MSKKSPQVLLVGWAEVPRSALVERFLQRGCECRCAETLKEGSALLGDAEFDLVLSRIHLADGSALRLAPLVEKLEGSLYLLLAVDSTCWWLPAVTQGKSSWGEPALRPGEFGSRMESLLQEIEAQGKQRQTAGATSTHAGS